MWTLDYQEETWSTIFPKNFKYQVQSQTFKADFGLEGHESQNGSHELMLQGPLC